MGTTSLCSEAEAIQRSMNSNPQALAGVLSSPVVHAVVPVVAHGQPGAGLSLPPILSSLQQCQLLLAGS